MQTDLLHKQKDTSDLISAFLFWGCYIFTELDNLNFIYFNLGMKKKHFRWTG